MEPELRVAYELAMKAHSGQFRRDGKTPYIQHPMAVAQAVAKYGPKYQAVAILHDVLEDTPITEDDMESAGISEQVRLACRSLTHDKANGEPYMAYVQRQRQSDITRIVKWADILHNLSDSPTPKQVKKYASALIALSS